MKINLLILTGWILTSCLNLSADIISDLSSSTIIEEFLFDDVLGTAYNTSVNNVSPGNLLSTDSDLSGVATDGSGNLNASVKSNTDFGSTLVDTADLTSGRIFGVMELTWNFQSILDTAQNEEIRLSLISGGTSTVLAEFEIQREDDDTVSLFGNGVGTGATDIAAVTLNGGSLLQADTFIGVIEADLDLDTYSVYYSVNGGTSFTTLGTGDTDPSRDLDKLRIVLNNDLSNDNVLLERVYFSTIPEPSSLVLILTATLGLGLSALKRRK